MGRRKKKKIETWLSEGEWAIVRDHMIAAFADSESSFARRAMLAGVPAHQIRTDGVINELALAVNRLRLSLDQSADDDVVKLVGILRARVRELQKLQTSQRIDTQVRI